jgi:hypothetical protein
MDAQEATGALGALGLSLPTPAYLLGALLFGIFGWVAYRRGKTTSSSMLRWSGLVLMIYPYAVSETWLLWVLGAALSGWVWWNWE